MFISKRLLSLLLYSLSLLMLSSTASALPFDIIPKTGTQLPSSVNPGNTATAYYTVSNRTHEPRNGNFVKYLPPNVTQVTANGTFGDTCGITFNLAPNGQVGSSCTLQLAVSGAVDANDLAPQNNLFVCFTGGTTCAGTFFRLSVNQQSQVTPPPPPAIPPVSIAVTPASVYSSSGGTQQFTAIGTYADGSTQNISANVTWTSSTPAAAIINGSGVATGVAVGSTNIMASFGSITSNTVTFQVANNIYFTNLSGSTISQCALNTNGSLATPCTVIANIGDPIGISLNTKAPFAYIAYNLPPGPNPFQFCPINPDGSFGSCTTTTDQFGNQVGIAVNPPGTFVYLLDFNIVTQCTINVDGSVSNCNSAGGGASGSRGIVFNIQNTFAYIPQFSGQIQVCPVNPDGTFATCVTSTQAIGNLSGPAINNAGTKFYVASDNGNVYICPTDPTSGNIGTCIVAKNFANNPKSVGINPANTFAYVGDVANNVSVCPINSDGTFGTCTIQTDSTFNQLESIAVGY